MGMNDRFDLDAALTELAGDVAKATPRPGADLMARVLADAANVVASKAAMDRASAATRVTNVKRPSLFDMLFGWTVASLPSSISGLSNDFLITVAKSCSSSEY